MSISVLWTVELFCKKGRKCCVNSTTGNITATNTVLAKHSGDSETCSGTSRLVYNLQLYHGMSWWGGKSDASDCSVMCSLVLYYGEMRLVGVCMWCWAFFGLTHWQPQPLLQCATETAWQHFASVLFFWLPVLGDVWYFYLYGAGQDSNNCWSWENKTKLTPLGKKTPFSTLYAHTAVSIWMFWDHSSLPTSAQLS